MTIAHNGIMSCPHGPQMSDPDLIMHLRELSLQLATDARRIGAEHSEIREKYAIQSEAVTQVIRRFAEYESEERASDRLRATMGSILDAVALVLKGPPGELKAHSWHDLPECAEWLKTHADNLAAECKAWRTWVGPDVGIQGIDDARKVVDIHANSLKSIQKSLQ